MDIDIVKSKKVCSNNPWFVGVAHGEIYKGRHMVRIGLYWWHVCIAWGANAKQ